MPLPALVAVAAGISGYLVVRRRRRQGDPKPMKNPSEYELEASLPEPMRAHVLRLMHGCGMSRKAETVARSLASTLSVGYPHAAHSLRRRLWETSGRNGPMPEFGVLPVNDERVLGFDPGRDYKTGPLGYGLGPEGLDEAMPPKTAADVRKLLQLTEEQFLWRVTGGDFVNHLASYADYLDNGGWPLGAETVRSRANYAKRQAVAHGERAVAMTYRLDPELRVDVRRFVEWCLDNSRRPEQLEAVAVHIGRNRPWTRYQLRHRANELRVGTDQIA